MKKLAIIPARSGSKRLPGKNIRMFHGRPIITYTMQECLGSGIFDEVMVSTDSEKIAEIALGAGATVPFMRSADNSSDFATTAQVILEVLFEYKKRGTEFDYVCCIYPTSVFLKSLHLKKAIEQLESDNLDSIISYTKYSNPIQRALKIEDSLIKFTHPENAQ